MPLDYRRELELLPALHGRHKSYGAAYAKEVKELISDGLLTLVDNRYRTVFPGLSAHQRLEFEALIARADEYADKVLVDRTLPRHLQNAASTGIRTWRDRAIGFLGTGGSLDPDTITVFTGGLRDVLPPERPISYSPPTRQR